MPRQGLGEDGGSSLGEGADCAECDVCSGAGVGDSGGRGRVVQRNSAATNRWVTLATRFPNLITDKTNSMIKHEGGKGRKNCPGFSPWSCSVLFD